MRPGIPEPDGLGGERFRTHPSPWGIIHGPRSTRWSPSRSGDQVARKGRAQRFREAREMKQGFDDGLFREDGRTLADVDEDDAGVVYLDDEDDSDEPEPWDPDERPEARG